MYLLTENLLSNVQTQDTESKFWLREPVRERVNRVPEIWDMVFSYVNEMEPDDKAQTLTSCALVCRAWNVPAAKVLWAFLPSIIPLLEMLGDMQPNNQNVVVCNPDSNMPYTP